MQSSTLAVLRVVALFEYFVYFVVSKIYAGSPARWQRFTCFADALATFFTCMVFFPYGIVFTLCYMD